MAFQSKGVKGAESVCSALESGGLIRVVTELRLGFVAAIGCGVGDLMVGVGVCVVGGGRREGCSVDLPCLFNC